MAQNTYIYLQLDEVSGSIVRDLERYISWGKQEKKLSCERRRAFVVYGWALLKAHCWTHAEYVLAAADVDEVAKIDGFSDALLAAGYAELQKKTDNSEVSGACREIKIERFSPENIANKNKLCKDNQRKRGKRMTESGSEMSEKKRTHVREKPDARPVSSILDNIVYNNSLKNEYDSEGRDKRLAAARKSEAFIKWMQDNHPVTRIESLEVSLSGQERLRELVCEWLASEQASGNRDGES